QNKNINLSNVSVWATPRQKIGCRAFGPIAISQTTLLMKTLPLNIKCVAVKGSVSLLPLTSSSSLIHSTENIKMLCTEPCSLTWLRMLIRLHGRVNLDGREFVQIGSDMVELRS